MEQRAVITADIVNYTGLQAADRRKLIHVIASLARPYKLEFYRGDSFQVYLKRADKSLELILKMRTAARKMNHGSRMPIADVRASIGIGRVKQPVRALKTATGEAFILSGRNFDSIGKSRQRLIIQSQDPAAASTLKVIAYFADYLVMQLTSKQAEVVFESLNGRNQTAIAKKLNKAQATINQHLQAAGWTELEKLLNEFVRLTAQS